MRASLFVESLQLLLTLFGNYLLGVSLALAIAEIIALLTSATHTSNHASKIIANSR